ncbi:MAG: tRNA (adenosine(37)-N6)-threonylcarbamoyltransferase complex dimerization subunit type 1 TsaB [Saprospiraceae bacterium]|nr:tRNA (adenosine(37)-N6)-threonylcarbamoyltransferase complex dimerization subunit type 1 TsaB [Saprospiraceae bacterium]
MPIILYIETTTEICSIGISQDEELIALQEISQFSDHASKITLLIEGCLKEANISLNNLDAVAVSKGPGSYTALRIGVSTAKGICYALGKPLIAVDTLKALALATLNAEHKNAFYCPMIDARRMEVYCAIFDKNNTIIQEAAALKIETDTFDFYSEKGQHIIFSGDGAEKCKSVLISEFAHFSPILCSAKHLIPLALQAFHHQQFADLAYFEPFYLKPPNITTPRKNLL